MPLQEIFYSFYSNTWIFYSSIILLLVILPSLLFARFSKQKVFLVFTMLRTKHLLGLLDLLANISRKFWLFFADVGIVLGFGALGLDYLIGRKKPLWIRIPFFLGFTALLSFVSGVLFREIMSVAPTFSAMQYPLYVITGLFGSAGFILCVMAIQGLDIIIKLL